MELDPKTGFTSSAGHITGSAVTENSNSIIQKSAANTRISV
jgi:hypothetical protein